MKLAAIFTVKNNELFRISDDTKINLDNITEISSESLNFTGSSFCKIAIPWSKVELDEEVYNEEFLAALRDYLKILDDKNQYAVIKPVIDKELNTPEQIECCINAFNHTARRIKDCISVAGFELTDKFLTAGFDEAAPSTSFMETLAIKHAQYVYFADKANARELALPTTIVLY